MQICSREVPLIERFDPVQLAALSWEDRTLVAEAEIDSLARLFNSHPAWGDREPTDRLLLLVLFRLRGDLILRRSTIPESIVSRIDIGAFSRRTGGGPLHEWMKAVTSDYLKDVIGCSRVDEEAPMWSGRVDLWGHEPSAIAEIGNTGYSRAEQALTGSAQDRFFLVPFRAHPNDPLVIVEFVMAPRLRVELRREVRLRQRSIVIPRMNPDQPGTL